MTKKVKSQTVFRYNVSLENIHAKELEVKGYKFSEIIYDEAGHEVAERRFDHQEFLIEKYEYQYDEMGRLHEERVYMDENTIAERKVMSYDVNNRVMAEERHYQDGSLVNVSYRYNEQGQLLELIGLNEDDEAEVRKVFTYNGEQKVQEEEFDEEGELRMRLKWAYDESGQVVAESVFDAWEQDEEEMIYDYDEAGHRNYTLRKVNGKALEKQHVTHNAAGQAVLIEDEDGRGKSQIALEYDPEGRPVRQQTTDSTGAVISKISRQYDTEGRLLETQVEAAGTPGRAMPQHYSMRYEYTFFE